jgi:hypothetical protein
MSIIDETLDSIHEVVSDHRDWTVGTTDEPEKSKRDRISREWHCWDAGSLKAAHAMATHLIARGMKSNLNHMREGRHLYIFR